MKKNKINNKLKKNAVTIYIGFEQIQIKAIQQFGISHKCHTFLSVNPSQCFSVFLTALFSFLFDADFFDGDAFLAGADFFGDAFDDAFCDLF